MSCQVRPRTFKFNVSYFLVSIFILFAVCLVSCGNPKPPQIEQVSVNQKNKTTLLINNKEIVVEIVSSPEERALGLMFRQSLKENEGMLFIFEEKGIYPFWMKNTGIPLSIAFIDENYMIIDVLEMVPNQEVIRYSPYQPFLYALEMNQGWFFKNDIKIGDKIEGIPQL
jgi:uncharacterized membrane protein (UPF0127 family)